MSNTGYLDYKGNLIRCAGAFFPSFLWVSGCGRHKLMCIWRAMSQDARQPLRPLAALRESNLCESGGANIPRTPVSIHIVLTWMTLTSAKQVKSSQVCLSLNYCHNQHLNLHNQWKVWTHLLIQCYYKQRMSHISNNTQVILQNINLYFTSIHQYEYRSKIMKYMISLKCPQTFDC